MCINSSRHMYICNRIKSYDCQLNYRFRVLNIQIVVFNDLPFLKHCISYFKKQKHENRLFSMF